MSWVTNVMLSYCNLELRGRSAVPGLFEWFEGNGGLKSIVHGWADPVPYTWGGNKHPECTLYAGAFNHLDVAGMIAHLEKVDWRWPGFVQLLVMEQEQATFCIYMFREGKLAQVLPYVEWPPSA